MAENENIQTLHTASVVGDVTDYGIRPTAFLAENPEAFGVTSEARPLVGECYAIVAHGQSGTLARTPMYDFSATTAEELFDLVYAPFLTPFPGSDMVLRHNFTPTGQWQEHPVSKYGAVLCQMLLWRHLSGLNANVALEPNWNAISTELSDCLGQMQSSLDQKVGNEASSSAPLSVSVGAIYTQQNGENDYRIIMLNAGGFRFYLLDQNGMSPLWNGHSDAVSAQGGRIECRHLYLKDRAEPFALVVLSENLCDGYRLERESNGTDHQENLVWRDRMRMERSLLRAIDESTHADRFAECAARAFAGHIAPGRAGASGALTLVGGSFERFRADCHARLQVIEEILEILPDGYDADHRTVPPTLEQTEIEFANSLLNRSHALQNQMFDITVQHTEAMIDAYKVDGVEAQETIVTDGPLDASLVWKAFSDYDRANREERSRIVENRTKLKQILSDHWITLRPVFLSAEELEDASGIANRIHSCCLHMNRRLLSLQRRKRACLDELLYYLDTQCDALHVEADDYVVGRAGDESFYARLRDLTEGVTARMKPVYKEWQNQSERYRSLLAAYTFERDRLFSADIRDGRFNRYYNILEGTLSDDEWMKLLQRLFEVTPSSVAVKYKALLDALKALSCQNGALRNIILERDAVGRTCRELGGKREHQLGALLAVLRKEPNWTWLQDADDTIDGDIESEADSERGGEITLLTSDIVNHYHALVRRWNEVNKQYHRQNEAYLRYYKSYTRFENEPF